MVFAPESIVRSAPLQRRAMTRIRVILRSGGQKRRIIPQRCRCFLRIATAQWMQQVPNNPFGGGDLRETAAALRNNFFGRPRREVIILIGDGVGRKK